MHSTSGASTNLLAAADAARDVGMKSAALLAMGGGPLRARVDLALVVPTESVARAQELHITIGHIVCALVEEAGLP
jgi:D-sedoheptulose 7-phosphate isomerase